MGGRLWHGSSCPPWYTNCTTIEYPIFIDIKAPIVVTYYISFHHWLHGWESHPTTTVEISRPQNCRVSTSFVQHAHELPALLICWRGLLRKVLPIIHGCQLFVDHAHDFACSKIWWIHPRFQPETIKLVILVTCLPIIRSCACGRPSRYKEMEC